MVNSRDILGEREEEKQKKISIVVVGGGVVVEVVLMMVVVVVLTLRQKSPLPRDSEEVQTRNAASRRTANPTHYRLSYCSPDDLRDSW